LDLMKRLMKESKQASASSVAYRRLHGPDAVPDLELMPVSASNLYQWKAFVRGPEDTPYRDALYEVRLSLPKSYPHHPPKAHFVTKICHPNVHLGNGEICLDVLKEGWLPAWTLEAVVRAIVQLMGAPFQDSPLNCDAANLLRAEDRLGYEALVTMYKLNHAKQLDTERKMRMA
jgi:peroxin-4